MNINIIKKKTFIQKYFSIKELIENVHIAPFQRIEDKEHVDTIYNGLLNYYIAHKEIFLPNIISLAKIKDNEKMIVLDGQHRLSSLKKLYHYDAYISTQQIRTDVYTVENHEEAREIYNIINSSKKVELYTGDIAPYIIPKIQKYFNERFQKYCKPTHNPHCPNINLEQLGKRLQAYDIINRLNLTLENIELFIKDIHKLNQFYADSSLEELCSYGHKEKNVKEIKESKEEFYLGLYRKYEWIDILLEYREKSKPFNQQNHSINDNKRKRIPTSMRKKVWTKHFELIKGECFCCKKELYMDEFECGHIIPVKDGGQNTIDNLEPICRQCNQDMGTINLNVYKQLFF